MQGGAQCEFSTAVFLGTGVALLQRVRLLVRLGRGSDRVHVVEDPRRVRRARPFVLLTGASQSLGSSRQLRSSSVLRLDLGPGRAGGPGRTAW